ncbi:MAG: iron permease [Alphaproteobacteria bacterium]|nr:MAG: iron permease [Alphaproteobacteria bacterium]
MNYRNRFLTKLAIVWLLLAVVSPASAQSPLRQLLQLSEYIGADYIEAVQDGQIINEDEYKEILEFSALIIEVGATLTELNTDEQFNSAATALYQTVESRGEIDTILELTGRLRSLLLAISPGLSLPTSLLSPEESSSIFAESCALCHGITGQGNGELAPQMNPAPTDFTDPVRSRNRSVLGLFDAISNGIDGTSMSEFSQLNNQQRWSLAFYAGSLAFKPSEQGDVVPLSPLSIEDLVNYSPNTLTERFPAITLQVIENLRASPNKLLVSQNDPLQVTRLRLAQAHEAYRNSNYQDALRLAVSAYLDGFELIENSLNARDSNLRRQIEDNLLSLRQLLSNGGQEQEVEKSMQLILQQLQEVETVMGGDSLSAMTLVIASMVILLREGLEALLVVIALATVLIKTERRDALKYLHLGWVSALVLGFATWWAARYLFSISGANREIMEGVAALLAAVVLFYVGFWMHSKSNAVQWQKYIKENIDRSLKAGALWGIAGLAFLAVYREVFETILFYQALLSQAEVGSYIFVSGGFVAGAVLLTLVAWAMAVYSLRLPISTFFMATTYLLLSLSFILMGKAIMALQEAAVVGISPLPIRISVEWLGVGSTWQGVTAQAFILVLSIFMLYKSALQEKESR